MLICVQVLDFNFLEFAQKIDVPHLRREKLLSFTEIELPKQYIKLL